MSRTININIEYEKENNTRDGGGTTTVVIKSYRLRINNLVEGDYGFKKTTTEQRNFSIFDKYGNDSQSRDIHEPLINNIIRVLERNALPETYTRKEAHYIGSNKFIINAKILPDVYEKQIVPLLKRYDCLYPHIRNAYNVNEVECRPYMPGGRRRRPSRKYKKSAKRVFRKKSRSTRRR
jgi:hypothetical protein